MGDRRRLELTLSPDPSSVAEARGRLLDAIGPSLPSAQEDTLRLLVSEVVTNAVRHGDGEAPVEVNAIWNSEVRVEVVDHGTGFCPQPRTADSDRPGGFGLYLVGTLASRWGVESNDGTHVWFVL
jgi:anti-sigma regulatory factor (Ser/Thr protein kinase)